MQTGFGMRILAVLTALGLLAGCNPQSPEVQALNDANQTLNTVGTTVTNIRRISALVK